MSRDLESLHVKKLERRLYRGGLPPFLLVDQPTEGDFVRPYSTGKIAEIVAAPNVYGFDTGFVCYFRGWHAPRRDDMGLLWEHYVLNELHACVQTRRINYWRDKQGHEVDFVLARRGRPPLAIECKWSANDFDAKSLKAFATRYPKAQHFVVAQDVDRAFTKRFDSLEVRFRSLNAFLDRVEAEFESG
jgi:uncharacterized protein